MAESKRNGLVRTLVGITLLAAGAVTALAVSARVELHKHELKFGHVGIEERVNGLEADVAEIKADVKTLLSRP